jgi:hypothetical protein
LNKEQGIVADRIRGTQGWFDLWKLPFNKFITYIC